MSTGWIVALSIVSYFGLGLVTNRLVLGGDSEIFDRGGNVEPSVIGWWALILFLWPVAVVIALCMGLWWVTMPAYRNKVNTEKREKEEEALKATEEIRRKELVAAEELINSFNSTSVVLDKILVVD